MLARSRIFREFIELSILKLSIEREAARHWQRSIQPPREKQGRNYNGRHEFVNRKPGFNAYNPAMSDRNLSPIDKFLSGIDSALRTVGAKSTVAARTSPAEGVSTGRLTASEAAHAAGLMRVNHSGEIAAQGLYQGHALVAQDPDVAQQMEHAADEELDHLSWCANRLAELDSRPSLLNPVWYAGAFAIGAASGLLGDKWSLGFIAETEKQVVRHLDSHLAKLPGEDARSRAIVTKMRDEEAEHGSNANKAGAAPLPEPIRKAMGVTAKIMTGTAYWI